MKTRTSFVANSSSTSFVVAISTKERVPCPHCGRTDPDLLDLAERMGRVFTDDTEVQANGTDATVAYLRANYGTNSEEKLAPYIGPDWTLAVVKVSYHDEVTQSALDSMVRNGYVKVILKDS